MQALMSTGAELVGKLLTMIHERRNSPVEERPRDVLGMIVHARDENGQPLSDEQVLGHLSILLVAGHETTTTLTAWALYLLATMPEHRRRLVEELDEVLGLGETALTVDTLRRMKTMDNFVREVGRVYPPVVNVPRGVLKEFEFNGYIVPEGAQVRLSLGGCHRLPNVFENPNEFDPDRFAPPREEDKKHPYSLVTFGGGPRVCIGQHFAHVETKALLAHVLRNYGIAPVEGQQPKHVGFFNAFIPGGIRARVTPLG
jgi:cytochrome P450